MDEETLILQQRRKAELEALEKAERERQQKEADQKVADYERDMQLKYQKDREELQRSSWWTPSSAAQGNV